MKFSWIVITLCLCVTQCGTETPTASLLGTPSQDPIIESMRGTYRLSERPEESQLALGQTWTCYYRSASQNDFREVKNITYRFTNSGSFYSNSGSNAVSTFILNQHGLSGNSGALILTLKSTENSELVGEWSVASTFFNKYSTVPAITNPERRAHGYEVCRLETADD